VAVVKAGQIWQDKLGYFLVRKVRLGSIDYWEIPSLKEGWADLEYLSEAKLISDCISEEGMVQDGWKD
jgi:hypothetical protein